MVCLIQKQVILRVRLILGAVFITTQSINGRRFITGGQIEALLKVWPGPERGSKCPLVIN